ncbi:heterokaryon incompatibility protein-domain-containing protein [Penicillium sp. IBT 18751x]|nr:heterokaryon incompatibility protein-domain-containing protein [Penicillium sp. IBT 18751x]
MKGHRISSLRDCLRPNSATRSSHDRTRGSNQVAVGNPTPEPENEFLAAIAKLKSFGQNLENLIGQIPLSVASERGHEAAAKLLITTYGVEPDREYVYRRTPLLASASGKKAVVKLLLATEREGQSMVGGALRGIDTE